MLLVGYALKVDLPNRTPVLPRGRVQSVAR